MVCQNYLISLEKKAELAKVRAGCFRNISKFSITNHSMLLNNALYFTDKYTQINLDLLTWFIINILGILRLNFWWFRNTTTTTKLEIMPTDAIAIERTIIISTFSDDSVPIDEVTLFSCTSDDVKLVGFKVDAAMAVVSEANDLSIIRYFSALSIFVLLLVFIRSLYSCGSFY